MIASFSAFSFIVLPMYISLTTMFLDVGVNFGNCFSKVLGTLDQYERNRRISRLQFFKGVILQPKDVGVENSCGHDSSRTYQVSTLCTTCTLPF